MIQKKNIYAAALKYELSRCSGIEAICNAIGAEYESESTAWCWYEDGRTEKEIIELLRKIGYDIPQEIVGTDQIISE